IQLLLDTFIKSAVILSAAGLMAAVLRRASAASRHLVWSVAVASLLALPILSVTLPSWRMAALPSLAAIAATDESASEPGRGRTIEAAVNFERKQEPVVAALGRRQASEIVTESPAPDPVPFRSDEAPKPVSSFSNSLDWKTALSLAWLA